MPVKGRQTYSHVLNACTLPSLILDFMLVDFHQVYTLNTEIVRAKGRACMMMVDLWEGLP